MSVQIPPELLQSSEWQAALLLLTNTSLKKFFTTQYVDLQLHTIDFSAMSLMAEDKTQKCLIRLAAHLFNVWQFPAFPGEEIYMLDYDNKKYALLAIMIRHGVRPGDVAGLVKTAEGEK